MKLSAGSIQTIRGAYQYLNIKKNPELWDEDDNGVRIKSLVCFTVAPGMRAKGIATRLLERALTDAKTEGYDFAEAYPIKGEGDCFMQYLGPMKLYEKFGFKTHKELEQIFVVRKAL